MFLLSLISMTQALHTAIQRPDLIDRLVLVAPTVLSEGMPNFVRTMFRTKLGKAVVAKLIRSEIGEFAIRRAWFENHESDYPFPLLWLLLLLL